MRASMTAVVASLLLVNSAWAKDRPPPARDPAALAALAKMGAFLRTQTAMKIFGETTTDDVVTHRQKVELGATFQMTVRRPDRLRADVNGDRKNEQIFYDGKTFAVYQPRLGFYASFAAPPTLAQLVDVAASRYGLDLPLADLFYWGTDQSRIDEIRSAFLVGASAVKGVPCDHYAFHQRDVDWEIWIQRGDKPLPRKLVVTTTSAPSQPQHVAVLTWDLSPSITESDFTFTAPATAHRIEFETVAAAAAATRHGRRSKTGGRP